MNYHPHNFYGMVFKSPYTFLLSGVQNHQLTIKDSCVSIDGGGSNREIYSQQLILIFQQQGYAIIIRPSGEVSS